MQGIEFKVMEKVKKSTRGEGVSPEIRNSWTPPPPEAGVTQGTCRHSKGKHEGHRKEKWGHSHGGSRGHERSPSAARDGTQGRAGGGEIPRLLPPQQSPHLLPKPLAAHPHPDSAACRACSLPHRVERMLRNRPEHKQAWNPRWRPEVLMPRDRKS